MCGVEKPLTLTSLLAWIVYTVAGLMLLYVLSYGPAHYFIWRFPGSAPLIREVYNPLTRAIEATPVCPQVRDYADWWASLADPPPIKHEPQPPPGKP